MGKASKAGADSGGSEQFGGVSLVALARILRAGTCLLLILAGWLVLRPLTQGVLDYNAGRATVLSRRSFGTGGLVDQETGLREAWTKGCGRTPSSMRRPSRFYDWAVRFMVRQRGKPSNAYPLPLPTPAELDALVTREGRPLTEWKAEVLDDEIEWVTSRYGPYRLPPGPLEVASLDDRLLVIRSHGPDPGPPWDPRPLEVGPRTWLEVLDLEAQKLIARDVL